MKRIFVTGAGGFVGARACRFLQGNYEVLTLPKGWMASCTELQLMQSIAEAQPDVILHTAAISDTGYTEQHPEEAYRANVELPLWLARAAAQCGARLVGFSSDQVYAGVQQPGSLPETMELLKRIDVLVDGEFMLDKKDVTLLFKGSSNQRTIDVPKSLAAGKIIAWDPRDTSMSPNSKI